jgi:hypothetical protein
MRHGFIASGKTLDHRIITGNDRSRSIQHIYLFAAKPADGPFFLFLGLPVVCDKLTNKDKKMSRLLFVLWWNNALADQAAYGDERCVEIGLFLDLANDGRG